MECLAKIDGLLVSFTVEGLSRFVLRDLKILGSQTCDEHPVVLLGIFKMGVLIAASPSWLLFLSLVTLHGRFLQLHNKRCQTPLVTDAIVTTQNVLRIKRMLVPGLSQPGFSANQMRC